VYGVLANRTGEASCGASAGFGNKTWQKISFSWYILIYTIRVAGWPYTIGVHIAALHPCVRITAGGEGRNPVDNFSLRHVGPYADAVDCERGAARTKLVGEAHLPLLILYLL
jgi:hypothetical protein